MLPSLENSKMMIQNPNHPIKGDAEEAYFGSSLVISQRDLECYLYNVHGLIEQGGKIRAKLGVEVSGVKNVIISEGTAGEGGKLAAQGGMRRFFFCLCPAGDTPYQYDSGKDGEYQASDEEVTTGGSRNICLNPPNVYSTSTLLLFHIIHLHNLL